MFFLNIIFLIMALAFSGCEDLAIDTSADEKVKLSIPKYLYVIYEKNSKGETCYGAINQYGTIVVPPTRSNPIDSSIGPLAFSEELCLASGWGGYINTKGDLAIKEKDPIQFVENFSEGLAVAKQHMGRGFIKYGFIDKKGDFVIEPTFDYAYGFSEGLALVVCKGFYGFIDRTGKKIIEAKFNEALSFSEGLAAVRLKRKWGYIDKKGAMVIKPQFSLASFFSEGLAKVEGPPGSEPIINLLGGPRGYIDKTGKVVIDAIYVQADDFSGGVAAVRHRFEEKVGYIDKTGKIVVKPAFDYGGKFSEGLIRIAIKGKYGFIDTRGTIVIPPKHEVVIDFNGSVAEVVTKINGELLKCYINKHGEFIWVPKEGKF